MKFWNTPPPFASRDAITAVVRTVSDSLKDANALTLDWGGALLLGQMAKEFDDADARQQANILRDGVVDRLSGYSTLGLYGGLTGAAWACAYVDNTLGQRDDAHYEEIDDYLNEQIAARGHALHYDLIGGLAGIAAYFLERLPAPAAVSGLTRILEVLDERAEWSEGGARWKTHPDALPDFQRRLAPEGYFNAGFAHGSPGVLALAALAARAGVEKDRCRRLAEGSAAWILSLRNTGAETGQFPSWVSDAYTSGATRVAWCYGDLGIAAALAMAGREFDKATWLNIAANVAAFAGGRRDGLIRINDPGLCHGSVGVAHVLTRIAALTGDRRVIDSASHWYRRTLAFVEQEPGKYGFRTLLSRLEDGKWLDEWQDSAQFLTGSTGAALALLAAQSADDPGWDRALLLS